VIRPDLHLNCFGDFGIKKRDNRMWVLFLMVGCCVAGGPTFFVGVGVADPLVVANLVLAQDELVASGVLLNREASSSFHFTIALLQGPPSNLDCVQASLSSLLSSVGRRNQTLRGLGSFPGPSGATRVIFATVEDGATSFVDKLNQLITTAINATCPGALWVDNPNSDFRAHCTLFVGGTLGTNVTLYGDRPLFGEEMVSEVFVKTVGQGNKLMFTVPLATNAQFEL
jgi:2'-5' RNA ligase